MLCWLKMLRDIKTNQCVLAHPWWESYLNLVLVWEKPPYLVADELVRVGISSQIRRCATCMAVLPGTWWRQKLCGVVLWSGYIWERWSPFKSGALCNPTCTWLKLPCPRVLCRLATGSSAEGQDWKLFCSVQVSLLMLWGAHLKELYRPIWPRPVAEWP